jgi:hypothetical protein
MVKLFISHSSKDDGFVRGLRSALADHGQEGWIDSRELRGGDPLWAEIQQAIEAASAYAVVVSPEALQSKRVGKELRYALTVREQRGNEQFPVIPLSLDGTKLGVLEEIRPSPNVRASTKQIEVDAFRSRTLEVTGATFASVLDDPSGCSISRSETSQFLNRTKDGGRARRKTGSAEV